MVNHTNMEIPFDHEWFKKAIFYELSVRSFHDGNGDGIGDFVGLTNKLDYLKFLGINCVWLLPFYPSPLKDYGYDVADYYNVHPDLGTMKDFQQFITKAHQLRIRVIADLVLNHTSDQHPWFVESRKSKSSPKRNYYVWSNTDDKYNAVRIIFNDKEKSNWTFDSRTDQYYWHRFFSNQPDLNFESEEVQIEMLKIADFWLDKGLDGFRVDAIPYLFEEEGTLSENLPETHNYVKRLRKHIDDRYGANCKILIAEANLLHTELVNYFGNGKNKFHMVFHFPLMTSLFYSFAKERVEPLFSVFDTFSSIPSNCRWSIFVRNHDELTLEKVTNGERKFMWDYYASSPRMKINLGIRRRLAPLLKNNLKRIKLMFSILFSLPGTPFLYYGDEIGMGDNVNLEDRDGVRTPMQWASEIEPAILEAEKNNLIIPSIKNTEYNHQKVNVENQISDKNSLLHFMKKIIQLRKKYSVLKYGTLELLETTNPKILAFIRRYGDEIMLFQFNLSQTIETFDLLNPSINFDDKNLINVFQDQNGYRIITEYTSHLAENQFNWYSVNE